MSASLAVMPSKREERPTPEAIDQLAIEYNGLKEKALTAQSHASELAGQLDVMKEAIRVVVGDFGSAHAKKSKILYGVKHELVVSYGQSVSVDAAAVETFRLALVKAKRVRLLKAIFEKTIRWTMQPKASEIVRGSKLTDRLAGLAARCWVTESTTPRVEVREKK